METNIEEQIEAGRTKIIFSDGSYCYVETKEEGQIQINPAEFIVLFNRKGDYVGPVDLGNLNFDDEVLTIKYPNNITYKGKINKEGNLNGEGEISFYDKDREICYFRSNFINGESEGKCEVIFGDGDIYIGTISNSELYYDIFDENYEEKLEITGKGEYTKDGIVYKGYFEKGQLEDKKIVEITNGSLIEGDCTISILNEEKGINRTIKGTIKNGIIDIGKNEFIINKGDFHNKNNYKDSVIGKLKGDVTFYNQKDYNGYSAECYFTNKNLEEEKGIVTTKNNDTFEGNIFNNEFNINEINKSEWQLTGEYKYTHYNQNGGVEYFYNGSFENGEFKEGVGKTVFENGDIYEGDFINREMTGNGEYICANGSYYKGSFENGEFKEGVGKTVFENGDIYEGDFINGMLYGKGKYIKDGITQKVYFKDGKLLTKDEKADEIVNHLLNSKELSNFIKDDKEKEDIAPILKSIILSKDKFEIKSHIKELIEKMKKLGKTLAPMSFGEDKSAPILFSNGINKEAITNEKYNLNIKHYGAASGSIFNVLWPVIGKTVLYTDEYNVNNTYCQEMFEQCTGKIYSDKFSTVPYDRLLSELFVEEIPLDIITSNELRIEFGQNDPERETNKVFFATDSIMSMSELPILLDRIAQYNIEMDLNNTPEKKIYLENVGVSFDEIMSGNYKDINKRYGEYEGATDKNAKYRNNENSGYVVLKEVKRGPNGQISEEFVKTPISLKLMILKLEKQRLKKIEEKLKDVKEKTLEDIKKENLKIQNSFDNNETLQQNFVEKLRRKQEEKVNFVDESNFIKNVITYQDKWIEKEGKKVKTHLENLLNNREKNNSDVIRRR